MAFNNNMCNKIQLIKNYKHYKYDTDDVVSERGSNLCWRAFSMKRNMRETALRKMIEENDLNFQSEKENRGNSPYKQTHYDSYKQNVENYYDFGSKDVLENSYINRNNYDSATNMQQVYKRYLVSPVPMQDYGVYYPYNLNYNYARDSYSPSFYKTDCIQSKYDTYLRYSNFYDDKKVTICAHCGTSNTSLWRKLDKQDICNACALYYKLHNRKRPENLMKPTIRRRQRQKKKLNEFN
ncbi:hypothetical protein H311_02137 [Anncaliia algerae PRA109]|nr:hypothetical protein H311_02137 [Anncaliia algerae PRA109]